jgi:8-oxo-dGTP pyrophosphatase MutT (NUDIX family)
VAEARTGSREVRPARRAQVETSAGGVIYRWQDGVAHVLLIRDSYRNWGFPKGHLEEGETPDAAALREVEEETGLAHLVLGPRLQTIDWFFRQRGRLIHKFCHFYLIESPSGETCPQREEGITACRWLPLAEAIRAISYDNAREVLRRAAEALGEAGFKIHDPEFGRSAGTDDPTPDSR